MFHVVRLTVLAICLLGLPVMALINPRDFGTSATIHGTENAPATAESDQDGEDHTVTVLPRERNAAYGFRVGESPTLFSEQSPARPEMNGSDTDTKASRPPEGILQLPVHSSAAVSPAPNREPPPANWHGELVSKSRNAGVNWNHQNWAESAHAIERELRDAGAEYYFLESWGDTPTTYRFYCEFAPREKHLPRQVFDETGKNPLVLMRSVLEMNSKSQE